jgi:4-hydroxyphenylpyruvate dioxygenase
MEKLLPVDFNIDYVEIYTPMAKSLAYWHSQALGFTVTAYAGPETGLPGITSYVLESAKIRLVLTSAYPGASHANISMINEINSFIASNYCGVKRIALAVENVTEQFEKCIANGAIPIKFPIKTEDNLGHVEEAAVKLYDHSEITFIDRSGYQGAFKPGYIARNQLNGAKTVFFQSIDHIAAEVRINEMERWTNYLTGTVNTQLVQSINRTHENKTGMILNINQSPGKKLTLVIAEPETWTGKSKVQQNIDTFGPGIHHLAFETADLPDTVKKLKKADVEFINTPASYYDILRSNEDLRDLDIDQLQEHGILVDREGDTYLLQKFIKPISDRPFFFYEMVQRVNGYSGFALKNINVLKRAEEKEIMRATEL